MLRLRTAGTLQLNRGTFHRPIRAEYAAVAGLWPQQRTTTCAFVVVMASIGQHELRLLESARRAAQYRFEYRANRRFAQHSLLIFQFRGVAGIGRRFSQRFDARFRVIKCDHRFRFFKTHVRFSDADDLQQ